MKLENKQIGFMVALIIAFIMLFLPDVDKEKYSFNPQLIAKMMVEKDDHISPKEISQWIIEGKSDFQLVDIRSAVEFSKSRIKGAENIPLDRLLLRNTIDNELSETKTVIIYSNGNSHAHQAFLILKTAGKDVYVLEGGFNGWNKMVLNPKFPANGSDDEILRYRADKAVANFFGGSSNNKDGITSSSAGSNIKMKVKIRKKRKKKKLEGC